MAETAGAKSKTIIIEMAKMWGHWAEAAKRKETNKSERTERLPMMRPKSGFR
jgi:hypothetical protein